MSLHFTSFLFGLLMFVNSIWCIAEAKITFLDLGDGDAAVVQIAQTKGEPFTIIVDGGSRDSDLDVSQFRANILKAFFVGSRCGEPGRYYLLSEKLN